MRGARRSVGTFPSLPAFVADVPGTSLFGGSGGAPGTGLGADPGERPRKTPLRDSRLALLLRPSAGPPPRAQGACHRPPLPGRPPAPGPARAGRPRTPPLAAAPRRGAGAGFPHLPGLAGGGRRRCPPGNARPAGFRTRLSAIARRAKADGFIGVPIMPLVNIAASWDAGRALRADASCARSAAELPHHALRGARLQKRDPGWPGGHRRRHERRPVAALGRAAPPSARPATAQPWREARPSVARRFIGRLPWRRRPLVQASAGLQAPGSQAHQDPRPSSVLLGGDTEAPRRGAPREAGAPGTDEIQVKSF